MFIVLLRLAIGWQLVYEGLWKWDTLSSPQPWTSQGYLNNAQGPFRDHFRGMIGDADELNWLDYDKVSQKWDDWSQRFIAHYGLDEKQQAALTKLLEGTDRHSRTVKELPEVKGSTPENKKLVSFSGTVIKYDAEKNQIWFDSWEPPKPSEFERIRSQFPAEDEEDSEQALTDSQSDFLKQLKALEDLSKRLSYKQKLAAQLRGNPNVSGAVYVANPPKGEDQLQMGPAEKEKGYVVKLGDKQLYQEMIADYEKKLAVADQDYEFDHLATLWGKIQQKKNELVGPVKALEKSLEQDALKILSYEQLTKGAVPPENTPIRKIDMLTIYCLIGFGICLMCGFATRLVAIAAAGMLLSFYGVWPPWPGVPEAPGTEHALIINKNFIEAIALMAIAMLPTGTWFGVDGALGWLFSRKRSK